MSDLDALAQIIIILAGILQWFGIIIPLLGYLVEPISGPFCGWPSDYWRNFSRGLIVNLICLVIWSAYMLM